ncbi:chemotaxis protein CheA, partial [Burkholderia sp. WAC0059]|uniref:Hpt domain-containing protein n=1 Tax=Burkholderia sp. WAC0059 TaxID=2066022 RepID=UPI000CB34CCC
MTLDITQFYQTFFDEADELLAQMEQLLLNLDVGRPDPEDLAAIFRAAHSIKGGAATFGFTALTETTHILESLLDRARNNELVLRKDMIDTFLETKDVLSGQLSAYRASAEPDAEATAAICAKLERLYAESRGLPVEEKPAPGAAAAPASAAPVSGAPEHVVDEAIGAHDQGGTSAGDAAGGGHLRIVLRGVGEADEALLLEELGNLGHVVEQAKNGNDLTVYLDTDVPSGDIIAVCCFVIDESQITVDRAGAAPAAAEPAAPASVAPAANAAPAPVAP